jgi:hypothetical protein
MKKILLLLSIIIMIACSNNKYKYKYAVTEVHPNDTNVVYYTNEIIKGEMNCIEFKVLDVDSNFYYYYGNDKPDSSGFCTEYLIEELK